MMRSTRATTNSKPTKGSSQTSTHIPSSQATTLTPSAAPPSIPSTANQLGKRPVSNVDTNFPKSLIPQDGSKVELAKGTDKFTVTPSGDKGGSIVLLEQTPAKHGGYQTRERTFKAGTKIVLPGGTERTAIGTFTSVLDKKRGEWS